MLQMSHRKHVPPRTDVVLELGRCSSEVDITIVDRIDTLLNPDPLTPEPSASRLYTSYAPHYNLVSQLPRFLMVMQSLFPVFEVFLLSSNKGTIENKVWLAVLCGLFISKCIYVSVLWILVFWCTKYYFMYTVYCI